MRDAATWGRPTMADPLIPLIPPDWSGLGWAAGSIGVVVALVKGLGDWQTARITRLKLDAEREAASAARETSVAERETQIILGEKAYEELRSAQLHGVAELMKNTRLSMDNLRAQLQDARDETVLERARARGFRAAVMELLTLLEGLMPDIPDGPRTRLQEGLGKLRDHDGWAE